MVNRLISDPITKTKKSVSHGAFPSVMMSVHKVSKGQVAGKVFHEDLQNWYRELFKPVVQAGFLNTEALAGYRSQQVYLSGSRHVPDTIGQSLEQGKEQGLRGVILAGMPIAL